MQELEAGHDQFRKELHRLLQVLAAQRRLIAREARNLASPTTGPDETTEAQLVFAAQQRLKFRERHEG
jgi:hypothetical protein